MILPIGKGVAVKKIENDPVFFNQAKVFSQPDQAKEAIIAEGEKALVSMYDGAKDEGQDILRYRRFCDKVSKGTAAVEPLPPTSGSSSYHSLRVYHRVMEWKNACINVRPEVFGWHVADGRYLPIQTDQPAAPSELLDVTMSSVVAVKRTVPPVCAHAENMACLAQMCAENAVA